MMADLPWLDAIKKALEGESEPVHYTDIAQKIVDQKLRANVGATPANTVGALLSTSLKNEGATSPFEKAERGYYRLRKAATTGTASVACDALIIEDESNTTEAGLVHAFGMYWRRDAVVWNPTRLLGEQLTGSKPVDFASQRGVYLLHDRREVIYVGRAIDQGIGVRLKAHTTDRLNGRWDRFSWFGVYPVRDDGTLGDDIEHTIGAEILIATMEALLIEATEPPQNRKRGDGFQAVEFIQVEDPDLIKRRARDLLLDQLR
jgi:hypothetical protein